MWPIAVFDVWLGVRHGQWTMDFGLEREPHGVAFVRYSQVWTERDRNWTNTSFPLGLGPYSPALETGLVGVLSGSLVHECLAV